MKSLPEKPKARKSWNAKPKAPAGSPCSEMLEVETWPGSSGETPILSEEEGAFEEE